MLSIIPVLGLVFMPAHSASLSDLLYLDPGSGSLLIQVLLAAFLGGLYLARVYWKKIKSFFNRSKTPLENQEDKPADE